MFVVKDNVVLNPNLYLRRPVTLICLSKLNPIFRPYLPSMRESLSINDDIIQASFTIPQYLLASCQSGRLLYRGNAFLFERLRSRSPYLPPSPALLIFSRPSLFIPPKALFALALFQHSSAFAAQWANRHIEAMILLDKGPFS